MYLLPTVSIFYVQVELCHIFRDYDGRWQISDRGETQHKYYGTKSLFVLPWILADEIIFIVSYQTMKYKFNYTPLVKFLNFWAPPGPPGDISGGPKGFNLTPLDVSNNVQPCSPNVQPIWGCWGCLWPNMSFLGRKRPFLGTSRAPR